VTLNGHDLSDTSPLVGEVDARSASGGGSMSVAADDQQRPPSLTLPHKRGGNAPVAWRRLRSIARAVAVSIVVVAGLVTAFALFLGPPPLGKSLAYSTLVVDRDGRLLRPFATGDGRWRLPARADDVDPRYLDVLFAYEDRRFRQHPGVDPFALLRATGQFIFNGHHVSGASTLTMQVARLLEPRPRTLLGKLRQVVRAIEIERTLSKDEVLALYLSIAPFGGNLEGVRAASLAYFGKEPRRLTLGEAALLVALPQSPEARRPDRAPEVARAARNRVLDRVAGLLPASDIEHAKREPVPIARVPMPMLAPIAAEEAVVRAPDQRIQQLTIDAVWQKSLEDLARSRARALGPNISVAILAVDHATGEILAKVASADYFDQRRAGHVDMTRALRSPGSTLKPFIYGIGFEDGLIHPETLIDDRPARYGSYAPENFDLSFQGTVPVRKALQLSLNVPAIAVLDRIGASRLTARLAQAGGSLVLPDHEVPGLAMGLGGVGITLTDLVTLYGGLPRGGTTVSLIDHRASEPPIIRRLMEPVAAWYVGNILLGTPPPENAAGGRVAFKTGTSYGYRDAWAVGFDGKRTIGVWVGRPDGAPTPGLVGRGAAAPILFEAFARSGKLPARLAQAPKDAILAANAKLPVPLQHFRPDGMVSTAERPLRILFPPNGAKLDAGAGPRLDPVAIKVAGGTQPLTVLVNGAPVTTADKRTAFFAPDGPGFVRLTVMDAKGASDSVLVRVQ
jgi:penicillin-binding protein 1C